MRYYQNILAVYVSITIALNNDWVIRPGARYERTALGGAFKGTTPTFDARFDNFVPNFLVTRQFGDHHDAKFSYTERIRRPWIWDMNPYVNASDPLNLTFGNPQLRPEVTRTVEIGHGYQADNGFSLNSTIYVASNRNAIEQLITVDSLGVSRTTSRNVATSERLGASINSSIPLNNKWVLNASFEFYHVRFTSPALSVSNKGNYFSTTFSSTYTLPQGYAVQIAGNFDNGNVTLQGRPGANYNYRFTAKKEIFNKGTISIGLNNIFKEGFRQRSYANAPSFNSYTNHLHYNRSFTISLSWRLGSIKKLQWNDADEDNEEKNSGGKRRGG
jgi:outer membrane receptor protein involved in Fe transport